MGPYPYHSEQRGGKNRDNYEKDIKTQMDRQTDRQTDQKLTTDRQTEGQTDRHRPTGRCESGTIFHINSFLLEMAFIFVLFLNRIQPDKCFLELPLID